MIPNGTSVSVSNNGFTGTLTLKGTVNNGCGSIVFQKQIQVTTPVNFYTINGNNLFCTLSTTYSVNAATGSIVSWSVSPSGIVNLSQSNNIATLTKLTDGTVTLTSTVSGPCFGSPVVLSKTIKVGYYPITASVDGNTTVNANSGYYYSLTTPRGESISNIVWSVPSGWSIPAGQGTSQITAWTGTAGGVVQADFNYGCNTNTSRYLTTSIGTGGGQAQRTAHPSTSVQSTKTDKIAVYPNPAHNKIHIEIPAIYLQSDATICDEKGILIQQVYLKNYHTYIDVSKFSKGVYYINILNASGKQVLKFIKQ